MLPVGAGYLLGFIDLEEDKKSLLMYIALYLFFSFQVVCLLVWGGTLVKLYREVRRSKDVLPSDRLFVIHGTLLSLYLFLYFTATIANQIGANFPVDSNPYYISWGISNTFVSLA